MDHPPTAADIHQAARIIRSVVRRTPMLESHGISHRFGRRVLFKAESLQETGSFKFRGAYHFLSRLDDTEQRRGVVAVSSGNHAQGVAAAAARLGVPATIVMPKDAPAVKIERTRASGASVVPYDRDRGVREEIAAALAEEQGSRLLPPYDHGWTIAGQGTVGLEIAADCREAGETAPLVLVPCGGGGLSAGIALALEAELPGASVFLVEPQGFDDHGLSLAAGERVRVDLTSGSICDSLLAPTPGAVTFAVNRRLAAGAVAVSDAAVLEGMRLAFDELRIVVEPGGAVGLAALIEGSAPGDEPVVVVLSGGNVDRDLLVKALA